MKLKTDAVRTIFLMVAILAICAFGIAGIPAWPKHIDFVGSYKLAANPWGTALYQDGLHRNLQFNGFVKQTIQNNTILLHEDGNTSGTIDFSRDDILFDAEGNLYTESKEDEISTISSMSGILLKRVEVVNRTAIPASTLLYLVNPHIPGAVSIQFPQETTVVIDLDQKRIEFSKNITDLPIHVYEAIKDIPAL